VHIPDGYLSPETCAVALAVAVPAIAVASAKVARQVRGRAVPQLAMLSAFSFLIMMFNLPVPGGTSAHAVGSVLIAIVMGPAAAVVATAVALLFQALVFGDGGVLAYGANVVNMALIMPLAGLAVFRLVAGRSDTGSWRRVVGAAVGGYVGITMAGVAVGIELGIQPALFTDASGNPLYNPYPLAMAVPAMLVAHLVIAGPAEAIVSGAGYAFLARTGQLEHSAPTAKDSGLLANPGLVSLGVLAGMLLLTPLGLITQGTAFGEWGSEELAEQLGWIPSGLERWSTFWSGAALPDYGFADGNSAVVAYWVSALVGSVLVAGFTFGVFWLANRLRSRSQAPAT
jgi:cobalt/nickel transport system permease protein